MLCNFVHVIDMFNHVGGPGAHVLHLWIICLFVLVKLVFIILNYIICVCVQCVLILFRSCLTLALCSLSCHPA